MFSRQQVACLEVCFSISQFATVVDIEEKLVHAVSQLILEVYALFIFFLEGRGGGSEGISLTNLRFI